MAWLEVQITPRTGFSSPLAGSTLFGQWCACRAARAPGRLVELLQGYTANRPFAVVGDPRPLGFVPRPTVPMYLFKGVSGISSKEAKLRRWMPLDKADKLALENWLEHCRTDHELLPAGQPAAGWQREQAHAMRDSRIRATEASGEHVRHETWFHAGVNLVLDVILDDDRLAQDEFLQVLEEIGWGGYGGGASRGAGKFEIGSVARRTWRPAAPDESLLTLGHCTPLRVDRLRMLNSFYRATVHHGRHGALQEPGVPGAAGVVKAPVLMASPGALFVPPPRYPLPFYGHGLGGDGSLSLRDPRTIHQGYAPALPVKFARQAQSVTEREAADD